MMHGFWLGIGLQLSVIFTIVVIFLVIKLFKKTFRPRVSLHLLAEYLEKIKRESKFEEAAFIRDLINGVKSKGDLVKLPKGYKLRNKLNVSIEDEIEFKVVEWIEKIGEDNDDEYEAEDNDQDLNEDNDE